jgi:hypothetical protein
MIRICERCYHPITPGEPHIQLGQFYRIQDADPDGRHWSQGYVHSYPNQAGCPGPASPSSVHHLTSDE